MVGYVAVLFLVAVSAVSGSAIRETKKPSGLGVFGINFANCEAIVADVENIVAFASSSRGEVEGLIDEITGILAKAEKCSSQSIMKQITCYETVINEVKAAISDAEADAAELIPQLETLVAQLKADAMGCFGKAAMRKATKKSVSINTNDCVATVADVKTLVSVVESSKGEITTLVSDITTIMAKYNKCSAENIFSQITCYEEVIAEAKAAISTAQSDAAELLPKLQTLVAQLETDAEGCIGQAAKKSVSNQKVGINIGNCEAVVADVESIATLAMSSKGEIMSLVDEITTIMAKAQTCGSKPILAQITCYETVINQAKAAMSDAEADAATLLPKMQTLVAQLEADAESCI